MELVRVRVMERVRAKVLVRLVLGEVAGRSSVVVRTILVCLAMDCIDQCLNSVLLRQLFTIRI